MRHKCSHCGNEFERIFVKIFCHRKIYVDENGRRWRMSQCPDCKRNYHRNYLGSKLIDDVQYHQIKSGREAERIVGQAFHSLGWNISLTLCSGPDVTITKGERGPLTIEVKRAKHAKKRNCWMSYPVQPNRLRDDYCAIYFPDIDKIWVDSMADHAAACSKSGYRQVTLLRRQLSDFSETIFLPPCLGGERAFTPHNGRNYSRDG